MRQHYGVVYDAQTLALRIVISPENPKALFDGTHKADPGHILCTIPRSEVEGMSLHELGRHAIRKHTGREPPTMQEVHTADAIAAARK